MAEQINSEIANSDLNMLIVFIRLFFVHCIDIHNVVYYIRDILFFLSFFNNATGGNNGHKGYMAIL